MQGKLELQNRLRSASLPCTSQVGWAASLATNFDQIDKKCKIPAHKTNIFILIKEKIMLNAIKQQVTIPPDGVIKISSKEFQPGSQAEIIVILKQLPPSPPQGLLRFMGKGKGAFATPKQADAFIRGERDSWE